MKNFVLAAIILLSYSPVNSQLILNDLNQMNLNGNIESLNETTLSSDKAVKRIEKLDTTSRMIYHFNPTGNIIKESWNYFLNKDSTTEIFYYSPIGLKIGGSYIDHVNNFETNKKCNFDSIQLSMTCITYSMQGDSSFQIIHKYNKEGYEIERQIYNSFFIGGQLLYTYRWEYDKDNIKIGSYYFTADSSFYYNTFHKRTGQEITSETIIRSNSKNSNYNYLYVYDPHGNWIKKTTMEGKKTKFIEIRNITYFN